MPPSRKQGQVPNVLAYPVDEATAALEQAGLSVREVVTTAPPRVGPGRGKPRVIRQSMGPDGGVVLTVAFAEYEEADGA
ncbi:MAG: PASTA domain-containing protein [Armatimonadota bacterium]